MNCYSCQFWEEGDMENSLQGQPIHLPVRQSTFLPSEPFMPLPCWGIYPGSQHGRDYLQCGSCQTSWSKGILVDDAMAIKNTYCRSSWQGPFVCLTSKSFKSQGSQFLIFTEGYFSFLVYLPLHLGILPIEWQFMLAFSTFHFFTPNFSNTWELHLLMLL